MKMEHDYDRFRGVVKPVLKSKLEEFVMLGYKTITEAELWSFLTNKKWKKPKEDIHLYEIVEDIFSVKVSEYMSFATIESFKSPEFSLDNEEDWKELLK